MALNMSVLTLCKFTPLGFETFEYVNIPSHLSKCKFTPLGFETRRLIRSIRLRGV